MVGKINNEVAGEYGKVLARYFDEEDTVFVTSSDFCHWGSHFQYQPREEGVPIWETIEKLDRRGIELI